MEKDLLISNLDSKKTTHITFDLFKARRKYQFGYILTQKEQIWLFAEIRDFLELEELRFQERLKKPEGKLLDNQNLIE
ncbi:hypothetical protein [Hydrocoleum sp. CS-953]|uniref:hypothetical protein n=1 Tax=Microcoleaceae TaxID=1892252 RepID=UPI000B9BD15F|nr:hypothetical protein [Hydrocoleum sp. CS-953]OZH52807.1 hypothetical protein AFK68_21980 [Hydrocoleum sp. CS-953]